MRKLLGSVTGAFPFPADGPKHLPAQTFNSQLRGTSSIEKCKFIPLWVSCLFFFFSPHSTLIFQNSGKRPHRVSESPSKKHLHFEREDMHGSLLDPREFSS